MHKLGYKYASEVLVTEKKKKTISTSKNGKIQSKKERSQYLTHKANNNNTPTTPTLASASSQINSRRTFNQGKKEKDSTK